MKTIHVKDPVWAELKERSGNVYSLGDTIYTLLRQTDDQATSGYFSEEDARIRHRRGSN